MDQVFDTAGGQGMTYQVVVPASSTAPGKKGQTAATTTYFYICIADNLWRRVAIEAF